MKNRERFIFITILLLISFLPYLINSWDNTKPADSDAWNNAAGYIRDNWDALEVELGVDLNEAHPYYQASAPSTKPDGSTSLDSDDLGRIWIDSDNARIYVLTATSPTWSDVRLELDNNTYFTAVDNAGTGTVDLIKANTSDVAVLPDGSELATSGAPTADADIANKKYVDDELSMGSHSTQDDDSNNMLAAHAYLANQDGNVTVIATASSGSAIDAIGYVDTDSNPASGGTIFGRSDVSYVTAGDHSSFNFDVASGEYFEVTASNCTVSIIWRSAHGTLTKCTDQD